MVVGMIINAVQSHGETKDRTTAQENENLYFLGEKTGICPECRGNQKKGFLFFKKDCRHCQGSGCVSIAAAMRGSNRRIAEHAVRTKICPRCANYSMQCGVCRYCGPVSPTSSSVSSHSSFRRTYCCNGYCPQCANRSMRFGRCRYCGPQCDRNCEYCFPRRDDPVVVTITTEHVSPPQPIYYCEQEQNFSPDYNGRTSPYQQPQPQPQQVVYKQ